MLTGYTKTKWEIEPIKSDGTLYGGLQMSGIKFATCKYCGGMIDRDYINGRNRWHCDRCEKSNLTPVWTDKPAIDNNPTIATPFWGGIKQNELKALIELNKSNEYNTTCDKCGEEFAKPAFLEAHRSDIRGGCTNG